MFDDILDRVMYAFACRQYDRPTERDLETAFRIITNHHDEDDQLPLTKHRFAHMMQTMGKTSIMIHVYRDSVGEPLDDDELNDMLAYISVGKNGEIDWKSYIKCLRDG